MTRAHAKLVAASFFAVLLCCESPAQVQPREHAPSPPREHAPSPPPRQRALRVVDPPALSPFTASMVSSLRRIARRHERQDDVFMKVGDSSTVSRGFLTCFSDDDELDLAGRNTLRATIEHFRDGNASGRDPFLRHSRAAAEGWSARQVLSGHPSPLIAELRATRARFAFVMNGGNDVEGRDPYQYASRMLRIVELLTHQGVIPILNSVPPRADDAESNRWVTRYNAVSRAVAMANHLPYLDYHQVMMALPRHGLAGDGVHPNALIVDGRARACDFSREGLTHGHNARNLLALRALDALRRTVVEGEDAPDAEATTASGAGTAEDPVEVRELPFAELRDTRTDGSASIDRYPGCDAEQDESGNELVYRLRVDQPIRIRIMAVGRRDTDVDVHLLRGEPTGEACVERADHELARELTPGVWYLSVDTFTAGEPLAGEVLVSISVEPASPAE